MSALSEAIRNPNPCDGKSDCHCETGNYYVSCIDGPSSWLMAGPYSTHVEAESMRDRALSIADKHDGRAWFMSWGVCRMTDDYTKPGRLNQLNLI
jgi:hypothetical protein